MSSALTDLKPTLLWKHFSEILKIPHCSKKEKPLGDYILGVAERTGHKARQDAAGNIVVKIPASAGHETAPIVVLQGHLDMVCEKNSDVTHDFTKDPIEALIEGDWVTANGTTLGADNGIGLAAALVLTEDESVKHGPLELLFTVDEETGLNGARELPPDFLEGRILLNLDSEEEGAFTISCAGGADSEIVLPLDRKDSTGGTRLRIGLVGLRGGHSGIDIHAGRGNAVQLLARLLRSCDAPFELIDLEGGSKHNAIPREAFARVITDGKDKITEALNVLFEEIRLEFKAVEKDVKLSIDETQEAVEKPLSAASKSAFLNLLIGLPHGVMAMSQEIPGLVETSNNLAIVKCKSAEATVLNSTRSSILSALEATRAKLASVAELAGAKIELMEGYPAWSPNLDSELLKTMKSIYKKHAGKEAEIMAIHAGLECGIIGDKFPGMDMISFGPELKNPHSPDERVHIGSVERFWDLLTATLEVLA